MEMDKPAAIDRILRAAQEEFARNGFAAVNVAQIAEAAGVSVKLIYHYFGRKETLYLEALTRMASHFFASFESELPAVIDPLSTIRVFALRYADFYLAHPHVGRLILGQVLHDGQQIKRHRHLERMRDELLSPLRGALAEGQRSGVTRADLSAEGLFFHALVVTLGYVTVSGLLQPLHLDVPELRDEGPRATIADAVVAFARAH